MDFPQQVVIREVGPRDGFQSLKTFFPTVDKLNVIEAIVKAGVTQIETTSFVSSQAIPQLKDAADVMEGVSRQGVTHAAMVPNMKGAENALAAGADELVVVISASEAHNRANVGRGIDASLDDLDGIFILARQHAVPIIGAIAVAFGCPYQGDVPFPDVFNIVNAYLEKGAVSVVLADTTGMATPIRVTHLVEKFRKRFFDAALILHFHNNRGIAMANLLAGLAAGITSFDTALGGIGGCPYVPQASGNLATEDVVFMLEDMGISTGIDLPKIIQAARLLEKRLGFTLPGQVMKSGPRDSIKATSGGSRNS